MDRVTIRFAVYMRGAGYMPLALFRYGVDATSFAVWLNKEYGKDVYYVETTEEREIDV